MGPTSIYDPPYADDLGIPPDELLLRRIPLQWIDWESGEEGPRIRRGAFQDYSAKKAAEMGLPGPCMSVGLSSVLRDHGFSPDHLLQAWGTDRYGLASLRVRDVRAKADQGVMPRPTDEEPWHAVVFSKVGAKRTGAMEGDLAKAAGWVFAPSRPEVQS